MIPKQDWTRFLSWAERPLVLDPYHSLLFTPHQHQHHQHLFKRWSYQNLPSGKLYNITNYGKSPFLKGKTHYKWQFSIAMLVITKSYQDPSCWHPQILQTGVEGTKTRLQILVSKSNWSLSGFRMNHWNQSHLVKWKSRSVCNNG